MFHIIRVSLNQVMLQVLPLRTGRTMLFSSLANLLTLHSLWSLPIFTLSFLCIFPKYPSHYFNTVPDFFVLSLLTSGSRTTEYSKTAEEANLW